MSTTVRCVWVSGLWYLAAAVAWLPAIAQTTQPSAADSTPTVNIANDAADDGGTVLDALEHLETLVREEADARQPGKGPAQAGPERKDRKPSKSKAEKGVVIPKNATTERAQPREAVTYAQPADAYYGPYYESGSNLSSRQRDWATYRFFDGRPSRYGHGHWYRQFGDDYSGDTFRFGFMEGYNRAQFDRTGTEREDALLGHHGIQLNRGLDEFRKGDYTQAANTFKLAADVHHGDPAARLYAAHALFATGRYQQAVAYLRRAFELQPKIAMLNFDMRDDYTNRRDFDRQYKALEDALAQAPDNVDRLIMLGYVRYFSRQRDQAYAPLARADRLVRGGDSLARRMMAHCEPPDVALDNPQPTPPPAKK